MKQLIPVLAILLVLGCGQHPAGQHVEQTQTKPAKGDQTDPLLKQLDEPFDIHTRGETLLNEAVLSGQTRVVEILLQRGVDPNRPDGRPLVHAILNHRRDIALLLLRSGADPNLAPGAPPLYEAAAQGDLELMRALMDKGANVDHNDYVGGGTALIAAIEHDQANAVELLLEHKADPSIEAKFHGYPFDIARQARNERVLNLLQTHKGNCTDRPEKCN